MMKRLRYGTAAGHPEYVAAGIVLLYFGMALLCYLSLLPIISIKYWIR